MEHDYRTIVDGGRGWCSLPFYMDSKTRPADMIAHIARWTESHKDMGVQEVILMDGEKILKIFRNTP